MGRKIVLQEQTKKFLPTKKASDWKVKELVRVYYVSKEHPEKATSDKATLVVANIKNQPTTEVFECWLGGCLKQIFGHSSVKPGMLLELTCIKFGKKKGNDFPIIEAEVVQVADKDVVYDVQKLKNIVLEQEKKLNEELDLEVDWSEEK